MPRDSSGAVDNAKLERWLWCVALYPSVKDAKKAARAGAVQVNGIMTLRLEGDKCKRKFGNGGALASVPAVLRTDSTYTAAHE